MVGYVNRTGLAEREQSVEQTPFGLPGIESFEKIVRKKLSLFRQENRFCAYKVRGEKGWFRTILERGSSVWIVGVGTTWFGE
ncbi:hypothetical protein BK142_14390 [Paenibacillus glucanolyticus]|nr:hypothetical protein BK142_14390 [Paenibacillus glucanolyticus]